MGLELLHYSLYDIILSCCIIVWCLILYAEVMPFILPREHDVCVITLMRNECEGNWPTKRGFLGFLDVVVTWPSIATLSLGLDGRGRQLFNEGEDSDYDPLVGSQSYEFVCTHPQRFRWRRWWGWDTKIHNTLVKQHKANIHPTSHQWCTLVRCS